MRVDDDRDALVFDVRDDGPGALGRCRLGCDGHAVAADGDGAPVDRHDIVAADEAGNEFGARRVEDLARLAALLDPAVVHHDDQVGERHRLLLAVGDVDEADAELALEALELRPHPDAQERIERGQRLVEEKDRSVGDQSTRQRHPLLLAARELAGQAQRVSLHGNEAQHPGGPCLPLRLRHAFHLQGERDVVADIEMRKKRVALEHHRRAAGGWRFVVDDLGAENDVALGDRLVPGDHAERRRLAATGGPKQAAIGAGLDLQGDGINGQRVAVSLGNAGEFQVRGVLHTIPPVACRGARGVPVGKAGDRHRRAEVIAIRHGKKRGPSANRIGDLPTN